jgi:hypothetical protein
MVSDHWRDLVLFHEFFHSDPGKGLGASHQIGRTALAIRCEDVARRRNRVADTQARTKPKRVKQNERSYSVARFSALSTARTEANSMLVSTPAPQNARPSARLTWM